MKSRLQRLIHAYFGLPAWARPAVAGGALVLAIMIPRVLWALPKLISGHESPGDLGLALAAGIGAGLVGGLVHGLTRPPLCRLGRAGDYLSGVAILHGYLGSLMCASPYVFEDSALPDDARGWWIWIGLVTVLGLVAGHAWFSGPDGLDRLKEQRSRPQLSRLVAEQGDRSATLVSGWVLPEKVPVLVERVGGALGGRLAPGEPAHIAAAIAALPVDDEDGLEWKLALPRPVLAHFVPDGALVAVDVLLEGEHERLVEAVHGAFAEHTVDPLAA
jgi:hypothetical protein